jgi:cyclophilin family peptidyl-prolyl cis-trans isomerase
MYANGRGVPKDDGEAVKWYRKAAEQGNAVGQRILGVMYENGRGVNRDLAEAIYWYRLSRDQGDQYASDALQRLGKIPPPADVSDKQKKPADDKQAGKPKTKDKQDAGSKGSDNQDGGDKGSGNPDKTGGSPSDPNPSGTNPQVVMETSEGAIKIVLFPRQAPITVENFLKYVDAKFYDGTIFHRVISNFMIQGGGYTLGMKEKQTRPPIRNEAGNGISNERGTIAMARTIVPDSASVQFFINLKNNTFLDRANAKDKVGYAVFGRVISGMDVVDKIAGVETGNRGGHQNVPVQDVLIKSMRRVETK